MNIIEKYDRQFEYAGILMNLAIAYQFYNVWSQPDLENFETISTLASLMIFEFILVHSGVFMAVMPKKISLYILLPFYGLFALAFNTMTESNIILYIYLMVIFNRMRFAFSDVSPRLKSRAIITSIIAALLYFVLIFAVVVPMEYIPELGLTPTFLENSGYNANKTSGGIFIDTPHIAICFGFCYYCALSIAEALLIRYKYSSSPLNWNMKDL